VPDCLQIVQKSLARRPACLHHRGAQSQLCAARAHNASPAFVSKRIRLLEQELGVKLLHRTTRRVAVTEQGERVFHWAQRILDDIDHLLQE
jgi:DNA-binding transcriptional LysR family regulator